MIRFLIAAAALSCVASPVFAAAQVTATLETPLTEAREVIAGRLVWQCQGTTCSARATSPRLIGLKACKDLSAQVGRLTAFGGVKAVEGEQLVKCNVDAGTFKGTRSAS